MYNNEEPIDELVSVELGQSKEVMRDELYVPCHKSRGWIRCIVTADKNDGYRMYLESTHRSLLTAKRFDSNIMLISMSEDFACIDQIPKRGYVAKVIRHRDSSFHVCLTSCRFCDNKLGCFSCGRGPGQREVVAKVVHTTRSFRTAKVEMRCIVATIPPVSSSGKRGIWCPRFLRIQNPNLPMSADVNAAISDDPTLSMRFTNRLPAWSKELECLVLKFQGNRILCSSSKNFLLQCEVPHKSRKSRSSKNSESRGNASDEDVNAVLQFGKSSSSTYVLDFKFPMSPIQAFGIALTVFCRDDMGVFSIPSSINNNNSNSNNNGVFGFGYYNQHNSHPNNNNSNNSNNSTILSRSISDSLTTTTRTAVTMDTTMSSPSTLSSLTSLLYHNNNTNNPPPLCGSSPSLSSLPPRPPGKLINNSGSSNSIVSYLTSFKSNNKANRAPPSTNSSNSFNDNNDPYNSNNNNNNASSSKYKSKSPYSSADSSSDWHIGYVSNHGGRYQATTNSLLQYNHSEQDYLGTVESGFHDNLGDSLISPFSCN